MSCGFLKQIIFIIWHSLRHQTWVQILPGSYPLTFLTLIFSVYFFIFNSPWHQTWVQTLPGSLPCLELSTHCQSSPPAQTEGSLVREMEVGSVQHCCCGTLSLFDCILLKSTIFDCYFSDFELYKHDFSFEKPWEAKKRSNTLLIDLNQNIGMMKIETFMFYFALCPWRMLHLLCLDKLL